MKFRNKSRLPTKEIRPLIRFVESCFPAGVGKTTMLVIQESDKYGSLSGDADIRPDIALDNNRLNLINLFVSTYSVLYPFTSRHRKSVPAVTFNDWKEEFVLVLAHEYQHVLQFYLPRKVHFKEVDAERAAQNVLAKWRKRVQDLF